MIVLIFFVLLWNQEVGLAYCPAWTSADPTFPHSLKSGRKHLLPQIPQNVLKRVYV